MSARIYGPAQSLVGSQAKAAPAKKGTGGKTAEKAAALKK
jgi:hypothetical protein